MPSNLAGSTAVAQHEACLLRAAVLGPDCTPTGGECSGVVTSAITTLTATPEFQDDYTLEPENGCGDILYTYSRLGGLRRLTLSGEFGLHDWELMKILFGGSLVTGATGGEFEGEVIGWCAPNYTDPRPAAVYLEIFTKNEIPGLGECADPLDPAPAWTGHIFGKVRLNPGERTYNHDNHVVTFSGVAEANPNLVAGPWGDWPGDGVICNSPRIEVGYSQQQYEDILAMAAMGCVDIPVVAS